VRKIAVRVANYFLFFYALSQILEVISAKKVQFLIKS